MNKLSGRVLMHKINDFVENITFKTNEICNICQYKIDENCKYN